MNAPPSTPAQEDSNLMTRKFPDSVDVAIVGSGPCGAAYARILSERCPSATIATFEVGPLPTIATSTEPGKVLVMGLLSSCPGGSASRSRGDVDPGARAG